MRSTFTIFSNSSIIPPGFQIYEVTRSFSSRPFLCALDGVYRYLWILFVYTKLHFTFATFWMVIFTKQTWAFEDYRQYFIRKYLCLASFPGSLHTRERKIDSLSWQTDHCTPGEENGFQGAIKCQGGLFRGFAETFSALIVQNKNCQNQLLLKHCYVCYRLCAWTHRRSAYAYSIKPSLYAYVTHVINYSSTPFPYCKWWKAGRGLRTRLGEGLGELLNRWYFIFTSLLPHVYLIKGGRSGGVGQAQCITLASYPGPAQLSIACSTEKHGEPGIFSHVSMT